MVQGQKSPPRVAIRMWRVLCLTYFVFWIWCTQRVSRNWEQLSHLSLLSLCTTTLRVAHNFSHISIPVLYIAIWSSEVVCLHSVSVALNWLKSSNIEAITCFPTQDFALRTSFCQALTHTRSVVIAWWLAVLRKDTTVAWGPTSKPRGRSSSQSQAQSSRWSQDATFEQQNSKSEFWSVYTIFSTKSNCKLNYFR